MDYHSPFLEGEGDQAGFRIDASQDDAKSLPISAVDEQGNPVYTVPDQDGDYPIEGDTHGV